MFRVFGLPGDAVAEVNASNYAAAYTLNPYVFTAVNVIADAASTVDLVCELRNAKGEWEAVSPHPLLELLEYVNADEDHYTLTYGTVSWLILTGDAYWLKLRATKSGPPNALQLLPSASVKIKRDRGGAATYLVALGGGSELKVPQEDIVHFRTFNPTSADHGLSRIAPLEQTINLCTRLMGFNIAWLKNGGVPSLLMKLQTRMADDQWKRFVADWRAWRGDSNLAGIPFQIDGVNSDVKELGANPDANLSSSMIEAARDTILGVIGTPPATCGVFEYANYANSREQIRMLWTQAVTPVLSLMAAAIKSQLVPEFAKPKERVRIRYAVERVPAMQPDRAAMVSAARESVSGGIETPNEARAKYLGEEGVGPAGDQLYMPFSMAPITSPPAPAPSAAAAVPQAPEKPAETDTAAESEADGAAKEQPAQREPEPKAPVRLVRARRRVVRRVSDEVRRAIYKGFNRERDTHIARCKRTVGGWLGSLEEDAVAWLERQPTLRTAKPARARIPSMDDLFDDDSSAEALVRGVSQEIRSSYEAAGQNAVRQVAEAAVDFDVDTARFQALLRQRALRLRTVAEEKQSALRALLAEGIEAGENVTDLVRRVRDYIEAGQERYAETVARTEVGTAMNRGALDGYRQGGATGKEWLAIDDDRAREGHRQLDGTVVAIDEPFVLETDTGARLSVDGPQDPEMDAADACNCRCTTAPAYLEDAEGEEEE